MMHRRPNQTEVRSMDSFIQILCRFQKSKRKEKNSSFGGVKGDFLVQSSDGGGTFAYFFGIYIKCGYKNPSILTLFDSVDVAS